MNQDYIVPVTPPSVHLKNMEQCLKDWGSKLDELAQKALSIETDQRAAYDKHIVDLQAKLDHAHVSLEALRSGSEKRWETFKDDFDVALHDFERAFKH